MSNRLVNYAKIKMSLLTTLNLDYMLGYLCQYCCLVLAINISFRYVLKINLKILFKEFRSVFFYLPLLLNTPVVMLVCSLTFLNDGPFLLHARAVCILLNSGFMSMRLLQYSNFNEFDKIKIAILVKNALF